MKLIDKAQICTAQGSACIARQRRGIDAVDFNTAFKPAFEQPDGLQHR